MPKAPHIRRKAKRTFRIILSAFIILLIALVIQLSMLQFISDYYLVLIIAEIPSFFLGIVLIYFWLEKNYIFTLREIGFNSNNLIRNVFIGIVTGLVIGGIVVWTRGIMGITPQKITSNLFIVLSASCIVAPLFEEFIFRGLIFNFFMKFFPLFKSIKLTDKEKIMITITVYILTAAMFAFGHMRIPQIRIMIFITSIAFTYLYQKTGNIATPIITHSLYNLVVIMI